MGGCAASQSDARFENLFKLTWVLTWKFLSNPGPWASATTIMKFANYISHEGQNDARTGHVSTWRPLSGLSWYPLILTKSLQLIWRLGTRRFHRVADWTKRWCTSSAGVGVTKAPFVNFSVSKILDLVKAPVEFFESHSYLSGVTAAQLRRHLTNINVICNR